MKTVTIPTNPIDPSIPTFGVSMKDACKFQATTSDDFADVGASLMDDILKPDTVSGSVCKFYEVLERGITHDEVCAIVLALGRGMDAMAAMNELEAQARRYAEENGISPINNRETIH